MEKRKDRTDLIFWYPIVKSIVKTPKTEIVVTNVDLIHLCDGKKPERYDEFLSEIKYAIELIGGTPCFLRTGHTSGKHYWKDMCYLTDINKLNHHIYGLVEFSAMADLWGLPTTTWAVREMLPTLPIFKAFDGDMPITRELRLFVNDNQITHMQPYWPDKAIEGHCTDVNWKEKMKEIKSFSLDELKDLKEQSININKALPGYWSVDWLDTQNGWYMIDIAEGEKSYKYDFDWNLED